MGWFVRTSVIDGITRLYTYARVGSYPLVVAVGLGLDKELAAWHSLAAMILAIAICATLLLSGPAAYLIHEIRIRAANEAALAQERTKLREINLALTESTEHAETANRAKALTREVFTQGHVDEALGIIYLARGEPAKAAA